MAHSRLTNRSALLGLLPLAAVRLRQRQLLGLPPGRCLACADRREMVIQYPEGDAYDRPQRDDARTDACGRCGWQPVVINIVYVDGWHSSGDTRHAQ